MSIDPSFPRPRLRMAAGALLLSAAAAPALAQVLDSPIGAPAAPASGSAGNANGMVFGSGPGYHSPQSPFKPLQEREGIVSWKVLGAVTTRNDKGRFAPVFPANVKALNSTKVRIQGFMMPLDPGEKQTHFLLSSVPTTCAFCVPAGPEGLVEVRTKQGVRYTLEPVVVEGALAVLEDDPYGLYYRIAQASPVK